MQARVAWHNFQKQFLIESCWWEVPVLSLETRQPAFPSSKFLMKSSCLVAMKKSLKRSRELCYFTEHWSLVLMMTLFLNQWCYPSLCLTIYVLFVAFILFSIIAFRIMSSSSKEWGCLLFCSKRLLIRTMMTFLSMHKTEYWPWPPIWTPSTIKESCSINWLQCALTDYQAVLHLFLEKGLMCYTLYIGLGGTVIHKLVSESRGSWF